MSFLGDGGLTMASIQERAGLKSIAALAVATGLNRPGCGTPSRTLPLPLSTPNASPGSPERWVFAETSANVGKATDVGGGGKCFKDVGCPWPTDLSVTDRDYWLLTRVQAAMLRHQTRMDFEKQRAGANMNNVPLSFGVTPAVATGMTPEADEAASCAARISDKVVRQATLEAVALGAPVPVGSLAERTRALGPVGAQASVGAAQERVSSSLAEGGARLEAVLAEQFGLRNPFALQALRYAIYALGAFAALSVAKAGYRWVDGNGRKQRN